LTERQCQNWFAKFRSGNFDIKDAPRKTSSGIKADEDKIKVLIETNRRITIREIATRLDVPKSTICDYVKRLGFVSKFNIWVPHVLEERDLLNRIDICDLLLKREENDPFLKRIITGHEK